MKKILFVVCTHGDELAGLSLYLKYPYGRNDNVEWKVLVGNPEASFLNLRFYETNLNRSFDKKKVSSYEEKRAEILKKVMADYDVVYDMHTTTDIRPSVLWNRCLFVNKVDPITISECDYLDAKFIIWDKDLTNPKQFLPYHAKIGITVEYTKTGNVEDDRRRMEKDFFRIIGQKEISPGDKSKRIFCQAYIPVTQNQKDKFNLAFKEFIALTDDEKGELKLNRKESYFPVFINNRKVDPVNYCFLNKKIGLSGK